ncbi:MAG: MBL fold metallo-hydrolase [Lachnospiraceae bacterium]|nr:MBL fold metallo-hydrolase [Lachnospiraceae bacterium]
MTENISVNTQSSIRIGGSKIFYFDPLGISGEPQDADVVFITHDHGDHFSPGDIRRIKKADTKLVAPERMRKQVLRDSGIEEKKIIFVKPEQKLSVLDGYTVETIPAYNNTKSFHPKQNGWCGYVLTIDGIRYYIAGDMDDTKEAREVQCDVALVPIGGTYTMTAREAAAFINVIRPKVAIPTHYGSIVGRPEDGELFKSLVDPEIEVEFRL